MTSIALIGYGEVGRILAEDLRAAGHSLCAFDLKLASGAGESLRAHAAAQGVLLAATHARAVQGAELVISAVTASQAVGGGRRPVRPAWRRAPGSWISTAPVRAPRSHAAELVNAAGGRYVEGAVMTSVPPYRLKVPLLLGRAAGRGAEAAAG